MLTIRNELKKLEAQEAKPVVVISKMILKEPLKRVGKVAK